MAGNRTRWGYHQLTDHHARRLVVASGVAPGDLVFDLGAGTGAVTRHLLCSGAHVVAVELHPGRAQQLRERFAGGRLNVLELDLAGWRPPKRPFQVVANPPFAMTAGLLRTLTARRSGLRQADLVIPLYMAARWARGAGCNSARWQAGIVRRLPREAFRPAATQPTVVLRLQRRRRPG